MNAIDGASDDTPGEDSYASMLAELETILTELESDTVDVDVLALRVARAHELVEACRARIERARLAVEHVVGERAPDS
jgi:exodeoxyribonuclease VII small subunit